VKSLADLADKVVGMDRGSHAIGNWRDWCESHGYFSDPEIVEFGSKQAAAEAALRGAIAGWAEDYEVLASFARRHPELVVLDSEGIGNKQDGIGLRENDSKMRDAINLPCKESHRRERMTESTIGGSDPIRTLQFPNRTPARYDPVADSQVTIRVSEVGICMQNTWLLEGVSFE